MQIHELTSRRVNEGLMDTVKSAGQKVANAFNNPGGLGLTNNVKFATNQATARLNKATTDYVNKLAAEWSQVAKTVDPSVYAQSFEKWATDKLTTKESNSGKTLNLNAVALEFPEIATQLNLALSAMSKDPQSSQTAVENYLTTAVKGVQQLAGQIRKQMPLDVNGMPTARLVPSGTGVPRGFRYAVPYTAPGQNTPSYYYKNSTGWRNEEDQSVDGSRSVQYLEQLLKQLQATGKVKPERDPLSGTMATSPTVNQRRKVSRKR